MGFDQLRCLPQTKVLSVQVAVRILDDSMKECVIFNVATEAGDVTQKIFGSFRLWTVALCKLGQRLAVVVLRRSPGRDHDTVLTAD